MLKGVYTPGPHFWEPETACNRDQFYLCLSEKFPSLEEFSFLKDYGDESYIASVFKQVIGNLASYIPRKDLNLFESRALGVWCGVLHACVLISGLISTRVPLNICIIHYIYFIY